MAPTARMLCNLNSPTILSGGCLAGHLAILIDDLESRGVAPLSSQDGQSDSGDAFSKVALPSIPNVYFRLIGCESAKIFKSGVGCKSSSRVFIDTVFTLEETISAQHAIQGGFLADFRFQLPKNLPSSVSFADFSYEPSASSKTAIWVDSSSGVFYTLFASLEPISQSLIRQLEQGRTLSKSKSHNSSMDLYTTFLLETPAENDNFPHEAALRFHLDAFLEDSIVHRGPIVETTVKKIAGEGLFSESKPVSFTVNLDQFVIVMGTAFPMLISATNSCMRSFESIQTRLVATLTVAIDQNTTTVEYNACNGPKSSFTIPPGGQVDDAIFWVKLPDDIKIPTSSSDNGLLKLRYDLIVTANISGGYSVEIRIPVYLSRGLQLQDQVGTASAQKQHSSSRHAKMMQTPSSRSADNRDSSLQPS